MFGRLALLVALAVATTHGCRLTRSSDLYKEPKIVDKGYLYKQRFVYDVLSHYNKPDLNTQLFTAGNDYDLNADVESYADKSAIKNFLKRLNSGLLPQDAVYSIYYSPEETYIIYKVMASAKDFDTFTNATLYLRNRVNSDLFAYAFSLAVIHRSDTEYVRLPPLYEIMPHMFFKNDVLKKAQNTEHLNKNDLEKHDSFDAFVIPSSYNGDYFFDYNDELALNYLTEDIAWNEYYFYFRNEYPFLLNSEETGLYGKYRGEQYLYGHKQIMARYLLERLSNNLGLVENFDYSGTLNPEFNPKLTYPNGLQFKKRRPNVRFPDHKHHAIQRTKLFENRIMDAIDSGFILGKNGQSLDIDTPEGLNILGNLIEGNADSYNKKYYGNVDKVIRHILGCSNEPNGLFDAEPSALEQFATSMRDPAFYRLYFRILKNYEQYQENRGPYESNEIQFPDIKIENVEASNLTTFMETFDSSISYGLLSRKSNDSVLVKVRQNRLNHKPFNVIITVNAAKATQAAVKVFLAPKFDIDDENVNFNSYYRYLFEIDNFLYNLETGNNTIVCQHAEHKIHQFRSSEDFYTKIVQAMENDDVAFQYDQHIYSFPERLVLPKGHANGFPLQLFVYIAPVKGEPIRYISRVFGNKYIDNRPFGFPFNRPFIDHGFTKHATNFFHKDVVVYHN